MKRIVVILIALAAGAAAPTHGATVVTQFEAILGSAGVISGGSPASTESATGLATFILTQPDGDPSATTLSYSIQLFDLDLDGTITPFPETDDNVTAIHIHNTLLLPDGSPAPSGDTAGTLHLLNIFGVPRGGDDDDDMTFNAVAGTVQGLWEDTDATPLEPMAPTLPVSSSDVLTPLFAGDTFLMIHTSQFSGGAIGGFITQVPEPSSFAVCCLTLGGCVIGARPRRRSRTA